MMSDNMDYKETENNMLHVGNDSVKPNIDSVDIGPSASNTEVTSYTAGDIACSEFAVLDNKQVQSTVEGGSAQKSVENGLNTSEAQSSSKVGDNECLDIVEEGDNSQLCTTESESKARALQRTDVNNTLWGCDSSDLTDTAMFTHRRDSSSDSVDSDSSSSSSSSSDWDSSSDTAPVSDEDSAKPTLPAPCAKPKRVVQPSVKTKGEFTLDNLPPIEDLHISLPEHECKELGNVVSIVDKLVVVQPHRDLPTLNLDSVLFLDGGKRAMGHVFDVFGQVKEPLYCVRFNSTDHIRDSGISVGTKVYCAPDTPYTNYVFVNQLMSLRGSDASWEQDNEPPSSVVYYSDDEEEREARRKLQHEKSKLRTGEGADGSPATPEPKSKRLNLMEERNNRRNLLLNATFSGSSQHGRRQARGRGWVAPSPEDYIIKPASLHFSTDWQPPPQDSQPEGKPKLQPSSVLPPASTLFGICRPPQFPFTSARFSVPPPLTSGKGLFGVLRSQAPEILTFVQRPPSNQPPVRTFVGSGGLPFSATQHPPSMQLGLARPPEATARPRPFGSPVAHLSFRPMQCPPSILTSPPPPPPFGVSFNMMQCPPELSTGRMAATAVRGPFRPPNSTSGMASQQREFSSASSKPMVFDPSQPPPSLPFSSSTTCGTLNSASRSQAFSPVSRVLLSPTTASARGASCQQPSSISLPFNPTQCPLAHSKHRLRCSGLRGCGIRGALPTSLRKGPERGRPPAHHLGLLASCGSRTMSGSRRLRARHPAPRGKFLTRRGCPAPRSSRQVHVPVPRGRAATSLWDQVGRQ